MQVTVSEKAIQNSDAIYASDTHKRIRFVLPPMEEGSLYILLAIMKEHTLKKTFKHVLIFLTNINDKDEHDKIFSSPFVYPKQDDTIYWDYEFFFYKQDQEIDITTEYYEKYRAGLITEMSTNFSLKGHPLSLVDEFAFKAINKDFQFAPGTLTENILNKLENVIIWNLIADYSIDMNNTPFDQYSIIQRILEWQKNYLSNRKL